MKKVISFVLVALIAMSFGLMTGCNYVPETVVKIAVVKDAYGDEVWKDIKTDFESIYAKDNVKLEFLSASNLEEVVRPMIDNGNAPDIMYLPTGGTDGLTDELVKARSIHNLEGILQKEVYGEKTKLKDKFITGFLDTVGTNPYQNYYCSDKDTYMLPLSYAPEGLLYNKDLFNEEGTDGKLKLPKTFNAFLNLRYKVDEMNAVSGATKKYLFGYGNIAQTEGFLTSTIASFAEQGITEQFLAYEYICENSKFINALANIEKINKDPKVSGVTRDYVYPASMDLASNAKENQLAFLKNEILFMPAGLGFINEMKDAAEFADFNLGFIAPPSAGESAQRYVPTTMKQIYILKQSKQIDMAEKVLLYMFSDRANKILAGKANIISPITSAISTSKELNILSGKQTQMYDCFGDGNRPFAYKFASVTAEGVDWQDTYVQGFNRALTGEQSSVFWNNDIKNKIGKLRAELIK